ncbi:MAG TPA: ABC transporter ATP-binding protein [bacterium]|nr:ABC transporter ATP-binding protein [bacterium]
MSRWQDWKEYAAYYPRLKSKLALILGLSGLQAILLVPIALLTRRIFDELLPRGQFLPLALSAGAILLLYFSSHGVALYNRYLCLQISKRSIQGLRNDLIEKIYALSRHFFTHGDHAKIHSAIVQDTERVDVLTNAVVSMLLPSIAVGLALCLVLLYLNPLLFLVTALAVPPLFRLAQKMSAKVRRKVTLFRRDFEDFSSGIFFAIKKIDLTRMQAAEDSEIQRQQGTVDNLRRTGASMAWAISLFAVIQNSLAALVGILVLLVGGWQVLRGHASAGDLLSFYVVLALLREQARVLGESVPQVVAGEESLRNLFRMLRIEEASPYRGTRKTTFGGVIRAQGLVFGYDRGEVLKGVDFTLEPGKVFLLAGPSGAGKSTLLKLLLGFYKPREGSLSADGIGYEELDFKNFRRQIGIILQEPFLFSGTIAENLRYGSSDLSDADLVEAARLAAADQFIAGLPQGYETPVGEDGIQLSGGQSQRIALARALLKKPAMLIFDEPTSHLDNLSVHSLIENIRSISQRATVLIVSHDQRLFAMADQVFYLDDGRFRETPWEMKNFGS